MFFSCILFLFKNYFFLHFNHYPPPHPPPSSSSLFSSLLSPRGCSTPNSCQASLSQGSCGSQHTRAGPFPFFLKESLSVQLRLASNSPFSCPQPAESETTGVHRPRPGTLMYVLKTPNSLSSCHQISPHPIMHNMKGAFWCVPPPILLCSESFWYTIVLIHWQRNYLFGGNFQLLLPSQNPPSSSSKVYLKNKTTSAHKIFLLRKKNVKYQILIQGRETKMKWLSVRSEVPNDAEKSSLGLNCSRRQ